MPTFTTTDDILNDLLGRGSAYPFFNNFESTSGIQALVQDIQRLLLTLPGERPGNPEYGCTLRNLIWENLQDSALAGENSIRTALDIFEPRIKVNDVSSQIIEASGLIIFKINFIILTVDTSVNLVFPFRSVDEISQG